MNLVHQILSDVLRAGISFQHPLTFPGTVPFPLGPSETANKLRGTGLIEREPITGICVYVYISNNIYIG